MNLLANVPLGSCQGARPWLGRNANETCGLPSRLLIRTAANAYFPQVLSVLSLPDRGTAVETAVQDLWIFLDIVDDSVILAAMKKKPQVAEVLAPFSDAEVLAAIEQRRSGRGSDRPVKQVELDALIAAPEGFGEDVPIDPNFHARRLPEHAWRKSAVCDDIAAVVQAHRPRQVVALVGFTRFEAVTPDIDGEYDSDVERADLALEPTWFPAVENRGEGIFFSSAPPRWTNGSSAKRSSGGSTTWSRGTVAGSPSVALRAKRRGPFPAAPPFSSTRFPTCLSNPWRCDAATPQARSANASTPTSLAAATGFSSTPAPPTRKALSAGSFSRRVPSRTILRALCDPRRSARTTRSAPSTRLARVSRGAGSTERPVT